MDRLTEDEPSVSLDFVDADHVLLTFNRKKLFKRLPGCTPDHEDRLMHAAILEVPGGKVVKEADWYLHDRHRYLWPLGPGKFLLRRWNDLYVVDAELHESLLLSSRKNLLWVSVTPDGGQIIVETANDKESVQPSAATKLEPKYVVQFLDAKTLAPKRTLLFNNFTNVTGTSTGYVDLVHKGGDLWLLRFGPTAIKRHNVARVRSRTIPNVVFPTDNTLAIGRCATASCDYGVTAFTVTGHRLWRQHWPQYRLYPEVTRAPDGSRFGVSTLRFEAPSGPAPKLDDTQDNPFQIDVSQRDVFQQEIQVFDTASGDSVLSVSVSPAVMTGQNFSLSPDASRLALLRGSGVELFDLPPISEEERSKFEAIKTDIPDLYTLGSGVDSDTATETAGAGGPPAGAAEAATVTADAPPGSLAEKDDSKPGSSAETNSQPSTQSSQGKAPSTAAADPNAQAPAQPVPTFKVTTKAVVVDVVVTDNKGHPIRGLNPQDFQLAEDGKSQGIRYFREYSDAEVPETPSAPAASAQTSRPVPVTTAQATSSVLATPSTSAGNVPADPSPSATSSTTPVTAKASPNVFSNHTHAPQAGAVTMILFDMLNTEPQDQSYARQQLIKFLASKPKSSQLALCTLSPGDTRLRLIQGFTADETLLLAATKGKKGLPKVVQWQVSAAGTANSVNTVGSLAQEGQTSGFQGLLGALQGMQAELEVTDTTERAGYTIDAMMLLARYLSGISGRKNIVWLSGSFPIAISATTNSGDPSLDNPNYTYKIKRVTNLLADAQVAVYPVDVRGLIGGGLGAQNAGGAGGPTSIDPQDFSASSVISPTPNIPQDMQALGREAAERDTLTQFATATGGKAFLNTNGIREAIATANEQGSNYYSLSYTSTNKVYDGKFRKIKVQVAGKGYTLHYRQGYFADDTNVAARDAELARRARATAMQHGSPQSREIQFSVRVYPVGGKKKVDRAKAGEVLVASTKAPPLPAQVEVQHYSIDYTLEGSQLRFVPLQNASFRSTLALMITSFDREGRMLTGISNIAASDLQPEVYRNVVTGEFGVQQEVDIPAEATSMRLGIQDQMSNHLGTVDIPLPVPPDPNAPRRLRNLLPEIEPD